MIKLNEDNEIRDEFNKTFQLRKIDYINEKLDGDNKNSNYSLNFSKNNYDIFILETILEQFIPLFKEINLSENSMILDLIHDLINFTSTGNKMPNSKKKNNFVKEESFALEGKDFLYKTYISSSETKNDTFKFVDDDTLKINKITKETIRSLLILIKDELKINSEIFKKSQSKINKRNPIENEIIFSKKFEHDHRNSQFSGYSLNSHLNSKISKNLKNPQISKVENNSYNSFNHKISNSQPLLIKLFFVKKIIINETKTFDFNLLFILLNFIILNFCKSLDEIHFDGTFYSKLDQIDIMLKNGVFLYFIYKFPNLTKFKLNNKIEFLNENIAFKLFYDYCKNNIISDINPEKVEFNKINIFSILPLKNQIVNLNLNKICIDKISALNYLLEISSKNSESLEEIQVDKFISIPENFRQDFLKIFFSMRNLKKFKINILSSCNEDLEFLNIPRYNSTIKKFYLNMSQYFLHLEDEINSFSIKKKNHFDFKHTNLEKISLKFEKINFTEISNCSNFLKNIIPGSNSLKELSLGMIDSQFFENFVKIAGDSISKLDKLKLSFIPTYEENYENSYKNILILLENCLMIKSFHFENFILKYKNICDEEIKRVLERNSNLRELVIKSEIPFLTQYMGGFYYYVFPKIIVMSIICVIKKNSVMNKIYYKKRIIQKIFQFLRIKKEKTICISYKI